MTIFDSLAIHKPILTTIPGESSPQMWARAWQFTNNVCYDNRAIYAMIRKVGGQVCGPGVDCDKIIERVAPHRIYDLVRNGGGPHAEPIMDDTHHTGKPEDFAEPLPYDGTTPVPVPVPPTIPSYEALGGDAFFRSNIGVPLQADMALAGQALNDGSSVWFSRTTHSLMAALMAGGAVDTGAIVKKHRNEWRGILGLPPV